MAAFFISGCRVSSKLIPREILFGNPEKAGAGISPDGKLISYLAPRDGVLNIWVRSLKGGDDRPVTNDHDRGIRAYNWSQDSSHLFFSQDTEGDENTHLFSVNVQSGDTRDLTPFSGVRAKMLAADKHFPDDFLITMNRDDPKVEDVYHLKWRTGELELVTKNPGNVSQWLVDTQLKVRGIITSNAEGGYTVSIRDSEKSAWQERLAWGVEDNLSCNVLGFSLDGQALYLIDSRNAPTGRLKRFEIATGKEEVVAEDPESDVTGVMFHVDTHQVQMVYWQKDKTVWKIFDESLRADMETIEKRHGRSFSISGDEADQLWLLRVESDQRPVGYYLYDRKTRQSQFLFYNQSTLEKYKLAAIEPISLKARDGLTLHGYLTLPVDESKRPNKKKKHPMVLRVHGGPWSRDGWGYDPRVQWLANRGYAVLQINFRGSVTYGKDFVNAGNKEWGGKMQDDLTDAVHWAIQQGIADPKRIAIFGGSYGGYAALAGAAFTPELYRAAISVVGPSNLITFLRSVPPYWSTELAMIHMRVGNPDTEEEFLKSRSPLFFADKIRIPMLIAQGANDPRVKKEESDQIVAALKQHGIEHEYLLFPDEGHGFAKPENQLKFYKTAEAFLAKHLGGRNEP